MGRGLWLVYGLVGSGLGDIITFYDLEVFP